jgi:hypothetical protein
MPATISQINGLNITAESASYAATASLLLGSVTSASYAATASYSTTLGASITNDANGKLSLINSNNTGISVIDFLTASLALTASSLLGSVTSASYAATASLALGVSSSVVTDATAYRVALLAANNQNIVRTSGTNISYQPDIGQLQVPSVLATSGVTASLQGTASWATNAITASYALNAGSGGGGGTNLGLVYAVSLGYLMP